MRIYETQDTLFEVKTPRIGRYLGKEKQKLRAEKPSVCKYKIERVVPFRQAGPSSYQGSMNFRL